MDSSDGQIVSMVVPSPVTQCSQASSRPSRLLELSCRFDWELARISKHMFSQDEPRAPAVHTPTIRCAVGSPRRRSESSAISSSTSEDEWIISAIATRLGAFTGSAPNERAVKQTSTGRIILPVRFR